MEFNFGAQYSHVRIRPIIKQDIESLRNWRNDPANTKYLSEIAWISPKMQKKWFEKELNNPNSYTFAIDHIDEIEKLVGSISIYNIEKNEAEIGRILIGDVDAHGKKIGYYGLLLSLHLGFQKLNINKFHAQIHIENETSKTIFLEAGFCISGNHSFSAGGKELDLVLTREQFSYKQDFIPVVIDNVS